METIVKIFSGRKIVVAIAVLSLLWLYGEFQYRFATKNVDYSDIFRSKQQRTSTEYVVIHHTAIKGDTASILAIHEYHKFERAYACGFAYNFFLMKGVAYKIHADNDATAHAHSYNFNAVSICIQENYSETEPTFRVYWETAALAKKLARRYNIPTENIKAHREVDREPTECPGTKFEIEKVRTLCALMTIFI